MKKTDFELSINECAEEIVNNMDPDQKGVFLKLLGCHERIEDVDFSLLSPRPSQESINLAKDIALLSNGYTFWEMYEEEDDLSVDDWAGDGCVGIGTTWGGNYGYNSVVNDEKDPIIWHFEEMIDCCDSEAYEGIELTEDEEMMINYGISKILEKAVKIILEYFDTNKAGYAQESCCYPHAFYAISEHALAYAIENFNLHIIEMDIELIHSLAKKIRTAYEIC